MTYDKVGWNFDNSYARLPESFFVRVEPTPVSHPEIVIFNKSLARSLGLDDERLQNEEGAAVLAGNRLPDGAEPLAQAYAGHQFGHFTKLGDGRAILLGEQMTPSGERLDIQLKGPGKTAFSRQGDGRAALGPMLREYIISESMHALGIPTTRSLSVVKTGEPVLREKKLPGGILTRVATSHLRVGTFQYVAHWGSVEELQKLANYTIQRHFPIASETENPYLTLLHNVIDQQAELIVKWQLIGFVHGVMNTDNMTLSGETIDYGPCAFMDTHDPATVFSSIDVHGRYAYGNQPLIGEWNLARFAETLLPLLHKEQEKAVELAQEAISFFSESFQFKWLVGMRAKLGLFNEEEKDESLIGELLDLMQKHQADFTNTFRLLSLDKVEETALFGAPEFSKWYDQWKARRKRQAESEESAMQLMRRSNPAVIPRNHRVEEALEAAVEHSDYQVMQRLLDVLADPYAHSPEQEEYTIVSKPSDIPYRTFCGT